MLKKTLIALAVVLVVVGGIGAVWVRSVFANDGVKNAVAAQMSKALGQPVTIGDIGARIYPRVTVNLNDVGIGQPAKIKVQSLALGTDFRALLSRRIEHATVNLSGARIELPLPDFAIASGPPASPDAQSSSSPVEIASIDEVALNGVEIVSGSRTLKGDIVVVPQGKGLLIRKISIGADSATIDITGEIKDLAGPSGSLAVKAGALNFDQLLAFMSDFAGGAGTTGTASTPAGGPAAASPSAMNLAIALDAASASMGGLTLDKLSGKASLTGDRVLLEPVGFGLFAGRYEGSLALSLGRTPDFRLKAKLTGVDMAAATAFAGSPNQVTGKLSATIDLAGRGMDAPAVMKSARGTARVDVTDGTVKNLGLIQSVVVATSGRADATQGGGSRDEPFSRLGATLNVAGGSASTQDLQFESKDIMLSAAGGLRLDGSVLNFQGRVQLSDELSKQAGRDLVRYTQEQGRVTIPAVITGSADHPQIAIDITSMAKRALTNKANEEAQKAIQKGLGDFLKKK